MLKIRSYLREVRGDLDPAYLEELDRLIAGLQDFGLVARDARRPVVVVFWPEGCPKSFDAETGEVAPGQGASVTRSGSEGQQSVCTCFGCHDACDCGRQGDRLDISLHK